MARRSAPAAADAASPLSGDRLLLQLSALASPHRLRILAALHENGRNYVSRLARDLEMSRPLLHLHLQKLQEAGLVTSKLELSEDGKALNYFEATPLDLRLDADLISHAAASLGRPSATET